MSNLPNDVAPQASGARYGAAPASPSQKKKGRKRVLFSLIAIVVVGTASLLYYKSKTPQTEGMARFRHRAGGFGGPLPVVVNKAITSDIDVILTGLGTVTPQSTVTVTTQISGYLTEVNFKEGQLVNKGDLLAVIDPRPYSVALEQAQGQLLQAQAQYKEAQIDLDRYTKLSSQDSISKQQVDSQTALVQQYLGMVNQNQASVDNANLNLAYCHITAPFTGRVGLRLVDAGNFVTPNTSTGLVLLTQVKPITVIFTLPEDNIQEVARRLRSGAVIPVDAYNRDDTVKIATGSLTTIDNTVDTSTGTFKLRATFANDDEALFPNQFVNVSMLINTNRNATVIPTSAIERGQDGSFVYVVGEGNKVEAKPVTLGTTQGERVAVTSGVAVGDQVVVDGADRLKDGMEVDPKVSEIPGGATHSHRRGGGGSGGWPGAGGAGGGRGKWVQGPDGKWGPSPEGSQGQKPAAGAEKKPGGGSN